MILVLRDSKTKQIYASATYDGVVEKFGKAVADEFVAATRTKTWWEAQYHLEVLAVNEPPAPAPQPQPLPAGDYKPRYYYGPVNALANMPETEQRDLVRTAKAKHVGILVEHVGWKEGQWWKRPDELEAKMAPFYDEARIQRVPLHIYVVNGNSKPDAEYASQAPLEVLIRIADGVIRLADPTKDRIAPVNEMGEMDRNKRTALVAYVFEHWTGALVSCGANDHPEHPRVVVCERHPTSHTDFAPVAGAAGKPTFFVSDNHPMIQWLSNSTDSNAQHFDQSRVRQWKNDVPNSAAGIGCYGWMHKHTDYPTIDTLGA